MEKPGIEHLIYYSTTILIFEYGKGIMEAVHSYGICVMP